LSVFARDEDKICVVGCYKEDGNSCHGEGSSEVHYSLASFHTGAADAEDDVCFFRDLDLLRRFWRETSDDGSKYILGPRGMADYGTFDGCYADVEEAMFIVDGKPFEEVCGVGGIRRTAMREKNSEDRLKESRV
jgi:hypothetical protein